MHLQYQFEQNIINKRRDMNIPRSNKLQCLESQKMLFKFCESEIFQVLRESLNKLFIYLRIEFPFLMILFRYKLQDWTTTRFIKGLCCIKHLNSLERFFLRSILSLQYFFTLFNRDYYLKTMLINFFSWSFI
jgi:hypothetical protein